MEIPENVMLECDDVGTHIHLRRQVTDWEFSGREFSIVMMGGERFRDENYASVK